LKNVMIRWALTKTAGDG